MLFMELFFLLYLINSLANLFGIHERFYENNQRIDFEQLRKPLNLNNNLLNQLKLKSIKFLKNNLEK